MTSAKKSKRSCDRCHALKEGCRWPTHDAPACERCTRLDQVCRTERTAGKIGRKPRSRPIDLKAIQTRSSNNVKTPSDLSLGAGDEASKATSSHALPTSVLYASTPTSLLHSRYDPTSPEDQRLSEVATPNSLLELASDIRQSLDSLGGMDDLERSVLELCFAREEAVGQFCIGKSFHRVHQRDLLTRLSRATVQLKDGFLCCGAMFAQSLDVELPPPVIEMCQRRAASAVAALRDLEVTSREDISTCLALGVVVTTFALYVAGGETYSICRCVLGHIGSFYGQDICLEADERSFLNCLIFTEIIDCLLRGTVPMLRFQADPAEEVDRYFGVSAPLMAYLYDICEISHGLNETKSDEYQKWQNRLTNVENIVRKWRPKLPSNVLDRFDQSEVVNLFAQAKSLRLALLLLVHRLRHAYGTFAEHGRTLSEAILMEVELAKQLTRHIAEGLDLCVIVAFFEIQDVNDRRAALSQMSSFVQYSQGFGDKFRNQLVSVWAAQDRKQDVFWYNLHEHLPP